MSELVGLAADIQETSAMLAELRRAVAAHPESKSLLLSVRSVEARFYELEAAFKLEAAALGVEVCTYRLFGDQPTRNAGGLGAALERFQGLISTVYSAVKSGQPKRSARLSDEVVRESTLGFSFSFAGSVGFTLTLPTQPQLFEDPIIESVNLAFAMARATSPQAVEDYAQRLGPAAVRQLYEWARVHEEHALGADIAWLGLRSQAAELLLQPPEFSRLRGLIEVMSDEQNESVVLSAMLVGLDAETGIFHARFDDGEEVRGHLGPEVSFSEPARIPARHTVWLNRKTVTRLATGAETVSWTLERMEFV
ncbi:MAG: hypothetical protein IT295_03665 [Dehalococcoidia bacterium]|nr:hypothetical protein [Dehalococcoidia bacterium]